MKPRHGLSKHRLYAVWSQMCGRCNTPTNAAYARYGGRGIRVCKKWSSAVTFIRWAKRSGYAAGLTLDRIDNDGDYSPENCRFTTMAVQSRNQCRLRKNNRSGYRGVNRSNTKTNCWKARIMVDRKEVCLGRFSTALEAAYEYDAYVIAEGLEHTTNFARAGI